MEHARVRTLITLTFLVVLTFSGCGTKSSAPTAQGPPQMSLGATVDALAHAQMQQYGIPAMTIALAKNGSMLYLQAYGLSDLASQTPAQRTTIFEIGSITKQFTAALIMKLVEEGKLNLDGSVASCLPQYGFAPAITVRMLLNHTSGLADFTNFQQLGQWITSGVSESTVLTAIGQAGLQFKPGTQYAYSNSNYFVLGSVIETLTNQSYATSLAQYIFLPLSLSSTYYQLPPANLSAIGYTNNGSGMVPAQLWNAPPHLPPAPSVPTFTTLSPGTTLLLRAR
jgi:D-alanyl-D-alanine carboxypeptidase